MFFKVTPIVKTLEEARSIAYTPVSPEENRRMHALQVDHREYARKIEELIQPIVERILFSVVSELNIDAVNEELRVFFDGLQASRDVYRTADGMRIVGATVDSTDTYPCVALVRYKTDFYPCARYAVPSKDGLMPLGYFEDYDLYVAEQGHLPPTLIARYGHQPQEYISYNPALLGSIHEAGMAIQTAYNRAVGLRYDLKMRI